MGLVSLDYMDGGGGPDLIFRDDIQAPKVSDLLSCRVAGRDEFPDDISGWIRALQKPR